MAKGAVVRKQQKKTDSVVKKKRQPRRTKPKPDRVGFPLRVCKQCGVSEGEGHWAVPHTIFPFNFITGLLFICFLMTYILVYIKRR